MTLLGFAFSLTLLIVSIVFGDGMSMCATLLLSFLSTLIGLVNGWTLKLPKRPQGGSTPRGDVVIRYPNGSFLVVRCDEDVARELYFAPEEIDYNIKSAASYRLISLCGTVMLMLGVVALANAKLQLQFAWAGAYILINVAHWLAAAVPAKHHWDLSCYETKEESVSTGPKNKTFTDALWKAILLTKSKRWVTNGKAAPQTQVWDDWLVDAVQKAQEVRCNEKGELQDPLWPGGPQGMNRGIVWEVPTDWDPKVEWDKLSEVEEKAKESGFVPAASAA